MSVLWPCAGELRGDCCRVTRGSARSAARSVRSASDAGNVGAP